MGNRRGVNWLLPNHQFECLTVEWAATNHWPSSISRNSPAKTIDFTRERSGGKLATTSQEHDRYKCLHTPSILFIRLPIPPTGAAEMEHPIAARTLSSMFMLVLLLSPLLILPSDSREVPGHTGEGGTASLRSFASLGRRTDFSPPSPTANSNDAPGKG